MSKVKISSTLGVDPALSNTGICIIQASNMTIKPKSITTIRTKTDLFRQVYALKEVAKLFEPERLIVMEDFGMSAKYSQNSGKSIERLELSGMLKLQFVETSSHFILVMPSHLKSFIAGKANASKEDVKHCIRNIWKVPVKNGDEADATCLALIGAGLMGWLPDLNLPQQRVLEKIRKYGQNINVLENLVTA